MKHSSSLYALVGGVGLALFAGGCASSASPAIDASNAGHPCAAPGAYLATNDTVARSSTAQGPQAPVVNVDPLVMQGRGVAISDTSATVAHTVARTEFSRGGGVSCE
jgi:hypothetical protein